MDDQRHHPYENLQLNIAGHAHYEYSEVARSTSLCTGMTRWN